MKSYELVVLLHPDLEIDVDPPVAKIEKLVQAVGGSITKRDNWGKKRLAYPAKRQQFGIYIYFELELKPETVRQLESQLLITEEVIRFLLVKRLQLQRPGRVKAAKEAKPAQAQSDSESAAEPSNARTATKPAAAAASKE